MSFFKNKRAFSLTELLTTVGIVGTLSVIGIKSYQKQSNQAKTAEAKKSLAYVYSAERNFYNNWGGYHENLSSVGAVPTGVYNYDVGFGRNAGLASNYGSLGDYPELNSQNVLNIRQCTNFGEICSGDCLSTIQSNVGSATYFGGSANCQVSSPCKLKGFPGSCTSGSSVSSTVNSAGANANSFTAVAATRLKSVDVWSINQGGAVNHVRDGTQ